MAITKEQKKEITAGLTSTLGDASSVVLVNFHGLSVGDTVAMRRALRAQNVSFKVAKKTLIKRALDTKGYEGTMPELVGELAMAASADLLDSAREVYEFEKKFKEKITIMGGVFDGVYKNREEMLVIASIPGRDTLYAQFLQLISSPVSGFVRALDQIAEKKA